MEGNASATRGKGGVKAKVVVGIAAALPKLDKS
jgi:hypothetical protein